MDRKARLAALAAKAGRSKAAPEAHEPDVVAPTLKFRNYTPVNSSLEQNQEDKDTSLALATNNQSKRSGAAAAAAPKRSRPNTEPTVLEAALAKARSQVPPLNQSTAADIPLIDGTNEPPTDAALKLNADVKRNIQPQLDKLLQRTQRAIVSLLKERLEQEAATATHDLD